MAQTLPGLFMWFFELIEKEWSLIGSVPGAAFLLFLGIALVLWWLINRAYRR